MGEIEVVRAVHTKANHPAWLMYISVATSIEARRKSGPIVTVPYADLLYRWICLSRGITSNMEPESNQTPHPANTRRRGYSSAASTLFCWVLYLQISRAYSISPSGSDSTHTAKVSSYTTALMSRIREPTTLPSSSPVYTTCDIGVIQVMAASTLAPFSLLEST